MRSSRLCRCLSALDKHRVSNMMRMASSNAYAKSYANRRSATETELYKLMLFPADNSIAVVKSKQCSPSEQDGFLYVQSGRRKFTGVVLEEGKNDSLMRRIEGEMAHCLLASFLMLNRWNCSVWMNCRETNSILSESSTSQRNRVDVRMTLPCLIHACSIFLSQEIFYSAVKLRID
jgi:hypothetical protein